jgi:hypothetical protein
MLFSTAAQPRLQAVEIEIHDRRCVEREELTERQSADHGVSERLAQSRPGPLAECEGHTGHHCCCRRHQDWAEPQHACLPDGVERRHVVVALGRNGEIDQDNADGVSRKPPPP